MNQNRHRFLDFAGGLDDEEKPSTPDDDNIAQAYPQCSEGLRCNAIACLRDHWKNDTHIDDAYLSALQKGRFFILHKDGGLTGFVLVQSDAEQGWPSISHLYVVPERRKLGAGSRLLREAEDYIRVHLKKECARLWCDESLTQYYFGKGWHLDDTAALLSDESPTTVLLRKDLRAPLSYFFFTPPDVAPCELDQFYTANLQTMFDH